MAKSKEVYAEFAPPSAEELIEIRLKIGRTQDEMAAELMSRPRTYQGWELGESPVPGAAMRCARLLLEKDQWVMQKAMARVELDIERMAAGHADRVLERRMRREGREL